ncbi:MAG: hypothetical protein JO296_04840 [Pseudonocardiales bacterium]|nr:hypothetical protein [Pseudonocardiales bacterium]
MVTSALLALEHVIGPKMTDETSRELSPYALMSVLDGELVKTVLLNLAVLERKRPLCILEWGCGLSTLSYTKILAGAGAPFHWTALEYDPSFLNAKVVPQLSDRPDTIIRMVDDGTGINNAGEGTARLEIVCWNRGRLQPFFGDEFVSDRLVNLDAYVAYPRSTTDQFNAFLVDGRKRRRCLLVARDLLGPQAITILHDASRTYYHSALSTYPAGRFVGDDLWIGGHSEQVLDTVLTVRRDSI